MSDEGGGSDAGSFCESVAPSERESSRRGSCSDHSSDSSSDGDSSSHGEESDEEHKEEHGHKEGHGGSHKSKSKSSKEHKESKVGSAFTSGDPSLPYTPVTPPSFKDDHVPMPTYNSDPPPYTPYEAAYEEDEEEIVTHDAHLNADGEALYRFLLSMAATPPEHDVYFTGTHTETRRRNVSYTDSEGHTRTRQETYTVTVTDFSFIVGLTPQIAKATPVLWTVPDSQATYRGTMKQEVDELGTIGDVEKQMLVRREATDEEEEQASDWYMERTERGVPPWIGPFEADASPQGGSVLRSSRTIREWADAYCASDRILKEFVFSKEVYGWDVRALKEALELVVRNTGYTGSVYIEFRTTKSRVIVRSANRLSRALDNIFVFILLCVFLIYPFIYLWKRYSSHGGANWHVCGAAYALKAVQPPTSEDAEPKVLGEREYDWFKRWEATIRHAVVTRRESGIPINEPMTNENGVPKVIAALDGHPGSE